MAKQEVISWLLEESNPSVRYRTLVELLDYKENDSEVVDSMKLIPNTKDVKNLFSKMHPDGYWLQKNPRTKQILGDGVAYGSYATTHFILSYLAELGLTKENEIVAKAAERYLSLQAEDGDWWLHMSCLIGYNIHTFIKLGYKDDIRVKKALDFLLNQELPDNGYLCDMHIKKYKTKLPKSCIRGSAKALTAFSLVQDLYEHERVKKLLEYFLDRNAIYKSKDLNQFVNKDVIRFTYPITWGTNTYEILLALSRMGFGNDKRLDDAWEFMKSRETENGRYILDYSPGQSPWKVGKKGEENKWITFYVLLAEKYRSRN